MKSQNSKEMAYTQMNAYQNEYGMVENNRTSRKIFRGSGGLKFEGENRKEKYQFIQTILSKFLYGTGSKKEKKIDKIVINKPVPKNRSDDIPLNTLKLIEEAEKTIRSKLQSE